MPRHLLSDVDVVAISIVDKGANRKRFFLRKSDDGAELFDLPSSNRLVKADDWSAVYCVVAEPDWEENAGRGAPDPSVTDVWKDADEIRRASHKFMRNGALVNKMHETLEPFGQVVENFIAPTDFWIDSEVIKAGSWVVAIEPSEEGRAKIEADEFTGVSIQGTGLRELQKQVQTDKDGTLEVRVDASENATWIQAIGKKLGLTEADVNASDTDQNVNKENDVADEKTNERLEKVEETLEKTSENVEKTAEAVSTLAARIADIAEKLAEKNTDERDPAQEVYHRLDEVSKSLGESLDAIRSDVDKLAKGHSTQPETESSNGTVKKSDNPLAGLLD